MRFPTKRGAIALVLFLILLPIAIATHTAIVTANYIPVYETNPVNITLEVENDLSSTATINQIDVLTNGFNVQTIITLIDWSVFINNSILFSTSTAGISNWGSQKFGFEAEAQNVNQDTTFDWTITTTDTNSDSQQNTLQLLVLNDNTAPIIGVTTPGQYILGTSSELFSVAATDAETAISSSNLYISNCDLIYDNATNTSSMIYSTALLTCSNGVCSINQDLSSESEGDICFYYDVSNRGGETAVTNNLTTIIDRTAPSVTLTSPNDGTFITATNIDLQFDAQDNYDTQLDCNVNVNGNPNAITTSGVSNTYNIPVTDGLYTWNVDCTDEVALTGSSSTRIFTVDNTAPTITITAPAVVDRGTDAVIDVTINDAGSGVDQNSVVATITDPNNNVTSVTITNGQMIFPTTTSTLPGNYTVTITAADNLGQSSTQSTQFRIRETYTITLSLQSNIDASTPNQTLYAPLTGTVVRDDGQVASGTVDVIEIITNETLTLGASGDFSTQVESPQANGVYTIIASFVNGIDTFTATAPISVGPYCGNGVVDSGIGEQCDGSTASVCSDYGYSQGTTSCTAACTIDTSQCSNPPATSGGGGSSGSSRRSTSSGIIVPPVVEEERDLASGLIEPETLQPQQEEIPAPESNLDSGIIEEPEEKQSNLGIGAAWAAFINFASGLNLSLILALIAIGTLLYIFGWKKKDKDEWDDYFKRNNQ
jgi:hypothetical protein